MVFAVLLPIFGCACAIRIFDLLIARNLFLRTELTKIGTAYLCSVVAFAIFLPHSRLSLWCAIFFPFCVFAAVLFVLVKRRSVQFRESMAETLALVSLKMRGGRSFRQSLSEVTSESEPRMRAKLSELSQRVVFSQQKDANPFIADVFVSEIIEEFTTMDRNPHAAARRLAVLREKIRIENDFRRRSGQVLARLRSQSLVMSGLYAALAIFIAVRFGFRKNIHLFEVSSALFLVGLVWLWRGGRRMKWKV